MKHAITLLLAFLALGGVALADPVTTPPSQNISGTVTTGNTFQQIAPSANGTRKGCIIQNPVAATETLFVFFGPTASATTGKSISLAAGASAGCGVGPVVVPDAINVTAATTGHAFMAAIQ